MGRPVQTINEIIRGSKQITSETAIELSQALGTSPEFWTNLEAKYRLHLVGKEKDEQDIAQNQNRHPGIILGRLHYDKLVPHKNLRPLLVRVSPILGNFTDNFCDSKLDIPQIAEVPTNHDD
jgi:hypothetical protein